MANELKFTIIGEDKFSGSLSKLQGYLPSIKTAALAVTGAVTAAGAGLFAMAKSTATANDEIQKLSDQLGLSTEYLSSMKVAAGFAGIETTVLYESMKKLQVGIGQASQGAGTAKSAFEQLGISITDSNGNLKNAETIMPEIVKGLSGVQDGATKAALSAQIFGESGVRMAQLVGQGSAAFEQMTGEASKFGQVVSSEAGKQAAEFNDAMSRLQMSMSGAAKSIGETMIPSLTNLANQLSTTFTDPAVIEAINTNLSVWIGWINKGVSLLKSLEDLNSVRAIHLQNIADAEEKLTEATRKKLEAEKQIAALPSTEGLDENSRIYKNLAENAQYWTDRLAAANAEIAKQNAIINNNAGSLNTLNKEEEKNAELQRQKAELASTGDQVVNIVPAEVAQQDALNKARYEALLTRHKMEVDAATQIEELHNQMFMTEAERQQAWFEERNALVAEDQEAQAMLAEIHAQRMVDIERAKNDAILSATANLFGALASVAALGGKKMAGIFKALAIAEATINAYRAFGGALAMQPWSPANYIMAAAAVASGLANVARIAGVGQAHAGLTNVPEEATYVLQKGERVLAPSQNRDLTNFLQGGMTTATTEPAPATVNVNILPNATNTDSMLSISKAEWVAIVEEKILPAFRTLKTAGITI